MWLVEQSAGQIIESREIGGGCINHGHYLKTSGGQTFFLKTNPQSPPDKFFREEEDLLALQLKTGPRLPIPYLAGANFLLLEYLAPAGRRMDFWTVFGRQLAQLHSVTALEFGFSHDNYIGSTPQANSWERNGFEFFAEQRLLYQARLAQQKGMLGVREVQRVESLGRRLADLIPKQPASLLHGDLWGGNLITDSAGMPAIIDPAAYYGWAEAELAMTSLFGGFPQAFYRAYEDTRPLEPGYWARFPIYNLYHLLNHLNLFGEGYLSEILAVLARYQA